VWVCSYLRLRINDVVPRFSALTSLHKGRYKGKVLAYMSDGNSDNLSPFSVTVAEFAELGDSRRIWRL